MENFGNSALSKGLFTLKDRQVPWYQTNQVLSQTTTNRLIIVGISLTAFPCATIRPASHHHRSWPFHEMWAWTHAFSLVYQSWSSRAAKGFKLLFTNCRWGRRLPSMSLMTWEWRLLSFGSITCGVNQLIGQLSWWWHILRLSWLFAEAHQLLAIFMRVTCFRVVWWENSSQVLNPWTKLDLVVSGFGS